LSTCPIYKSEERLNNIKSFFLAKKGEPLFKPRNRLIILILFIVITHSVDRFFIFKEKEPIIKTVIQEKTVYKEKEPIIKTVIQEKIVYKEKEPVVKKTKGYIARIMYTTSKQWVKEYTEERKDIPIDSMKTRNGYILYIGPFDNYKMAEEYIKPIKGRLPKDLYITSKW
jgi:hypothetical protein